MADRSPAASHGRAALNIFTFSDTSQFSDPFATKLIVVEEVENLLRSQSVITHLEDHLSCGCLKWKADVNSKAPQTMRGFLKIFLSVAVKFQSSLPDCPHRLVRWLAIAFANSTFHIGQGGFSRVKITRGMP